MEKKMTFNYFYGTEADQFSFYRIPKALFTDSYFRNLSSDAKILYGLMLDRMSLSIKNQWFDDKNRAYIYFSIEDIMELLNCGRNKAIKSMRELDDETGIGLIEKRRQGFGKVNVIYVKTFMPEKTDEKKFEEELKKFKKQTSLENEESTEVYNSNFMKSQNQTSRSPENKLQEVYISNPNNTNLSDTEMNDNKSNHIISMDEKRFDSDNRSEDYQAYENLVKETIDYESLEVTHHDDMRQVDEIVNLIVETVMCKNDKILIASNWYPASLVKKKFLMLTYSHIEYVLHCMSGNTTKVKNIKKYLLAALFNAPSTMNGYYQAEVNHAKEMVFPIGAPNDGFAQYFSGRSFLAPISTSQVGIFNVTFEPGCRNNWHIHHAKSGGGQILVCVAGRGFYQEEGRDAVEMKPGDCINIPVDVKHWHGAAPDEWFSHLAIEVPGVDCSNEWCEAVSEKEYAGLR